MEPTRPSPARRRRRRSGMPHRGRGGGRRRHARRRVPEELGLPRSARVAVVERRVRDRSTAVEVQVEHASVAHPQRARRSARARGGRSRCCSCTPPASKGARASSRSPQPRRRSMPPARLACARCTTARPTCRSRTAEKPSGPVARCASDDSRPQLGSFASGPHPPAPPSSSAPGYRARLARASSALSSSNSPWLPRPWLLVF